MATYTSLNTPESIGEAIAPLAIISDDEFKFIAESIKGNRSFSLRKPEISAVSETLNISSGAVEYILIGLSYLYTHVQADTNKGLSYSEAIESLVRELASREGWDGDVAGRIRERIAVLLQSNPVHSSFKNIERIRSGFQPHAIGFSSMVELRPRYLGGDDDLMIDGYIPTMQFRITTDSDDDRQHVFQLTEEALLEFKRAITRLESKLKILKGTENSPIRIIEI